MGLFFKNPMIPYPISTNAWATAQGKLEEALKAYRDALAITERLAAADRSNTEWQSDLSISYNMVGNVLLEQGKLEEALKDYRYLLAIAQRLSVADRAFGKPSSLFIANWPRGSAGPVP